MSNAEQSATEVAVQLGGQAKEDAHTVFAVLGTAFASDRAADDVPQDVPADRQAVWTATFDVADVRGEAAPAELSSPVTATLQGGHKAVDALHAALTSAFSVRVVGTAAGDQEEEVTLRLESHR
ncbi:hypothetical protein [Streptomyces sp. NBC_00370]|uniref:hypothetical protein n=1 Tax=Streptomyces sp. NBC_00370 TaxID=2975728 RepID=UPI002E253101